METPDLATKLLEPLQGGLKRRLSTSVVGLRTPRSFMALVVDDSDIAVTGCTLLRLAILRRFVPGCYKNGTNTNWSTRGTRFTFGNLEASNEFGTQSIAGPAWDSHSLRNSGHSYQPGPSSLVLAALPSNPGEPPGMRGTYWPMLQDDIGARLESLGRQYREKRWQILGGRNAISLANAFWWYVEGLDL